MTIRYALCSDKPFWFTLDRHLSYDEFEKKVRDKQGYVLLVDNEPVGILRYNLFWDNTPFCNLLYIREVYQNMGLGKRLMNFWESEMRSLGYKSVMTSTRADESAQHFYRAIGYSDCGTLTLPEQPDELFLYKLIDGN
ncbi:MAG: GNAT family N-acetyltransferase [Clostridia bacterium]|nr:GNAT family N-acetyltransferase [Clostridia bacterium]